MPAVLHFFWQTLCTEIPFSVFLCYHSECFIRQKLITLKNTPHFTIFKISYPIYFGNLQKHAGSPTLYIFVFTAVTSAENILVYYFISIFKSIQPSIWLFRVLVDSVFYPGSCLFHYWSLRDMFKARACIYQSNNIIYMLSYFLAFLPLFPWTNKKLKFSPLYLDFVAGY